MTPISNVARRAYHRLWLVVVIGLLATGAAVTWAVWPVEVAVEAPRAGVATAERSAAVPIEPAAWDLRLWQPFTDAPVAQETAPPPLKLYSILKRKGVYLAALSAGDTAPMVYAASGDVVHGVTIRAVDATGVDLRSALGDQRLELRP